MECVIHIYVLIDANGNKDWQVVREHNDTIRSIGGIGSDGNYHQYDSYEAYYLDDWAKKHGMTTTHHSIKTII